MRYVYLLLLFLFVLPDTPCRAQADEDSTGVVIHADPRLDILLKKRESNHIPRGVIRSGRGYRVQIYSGSDRVKATQIKIDFLRRYPGIKTYMSYISPTFRLKVGDFRSRADAQRLWQQVRTLYNPSMIVPDIIEINTVGHD